MVPRTASRRLTCPSITLLQVGELESSKSAMKTLAPELSALMIILRSTGPVISTRRSSRSAGIGATCQSLWRMCAVDGRNSGMAPASIPCWRTRLAASSWRRRGSNACANFPRKRMASSLRRDCCASVSGALICIGFSCVANMKWFLLQGHATADLGKTLVRWSDPDQRSNSSQRICQLAQFGIYYEWARPGAKRLAGQPEIRRKLSMLNYAGELLRTWETDPRWSGIVRPYRAEDVIRLRGSVRIEYTLARLGAERLWQLLRTEPYVAALGALTGNQAVQQVQAGLKAIYLSGWQVAGDANLGGQMYPDQSLYPANSVPAVVRAINNALQRADQIHRAEGMNGRFSKHFPQRAHFTQLDDRVLNSIYGKVNLFVSGKTP